jgi:hypothetical protein
MPLIAQHGMVIFIIIAMFQLLKRLPANEAEVNGK